MSVEGEGQEIDRSVTNWYGEYQNPFHYLKTLIFRAVLVSKIIMVGRFQKEGNRKNIKIYELVGRYTHKWGMKRDK